MGETTGLNRRRIHFLKVRAVSLQSPSAAVGYENPDGTILRTTDGGNTWVRQSSGLSDPFDGINFFGVYFVNSNVGTVVGEEGSF